MATISFNVRMDESLKRSVDATAEAIGLSTAAAFNVFARQFVAHGGFPFDVVAPTPTEAAFTQQMDRIYEGMTFDDAHVHELVDV